MATLNIDVIKDIPGYKVILKTVLKSQIQQLVDQLASTTGEESMIITASISDCSLCFLGSTYGKRFIKDHEDIKSQFLSFCQKKHYGGEQQENEQHDTLQAHTQASSVQGYVRSPRSDSLQASPGRNKRGLVVRYEPYPMTRSRSKRSAMTLDPVCEPEQSLAVIKLDEDIINNINNEVSNLSDIDKPSTVTNVINEANSENIVDDDTAPQPTETSINSEIDNDLTYPCLSVKLEAIAETLKSFAEHDSEIDCKNVESMETIPETELEITGVELPRVMPPASKGPDVLLDVKFEPLNDDTDSQRDMSEKENDSTHLTYCDYSEQTFQSSTDAQKHASIHTETRTVICNKCGKTFDESNLSTIPSGNTIVKQFQCETCSSACSFDGQPNRPTAKKNRKNQHECDQCGKYFPSKSHLNVHLSVHTGIKPFKCDTCGKSFAHKHDLTRHIVGHSGIKPFKCDTCEKQFVYQRNWRLHQSIHTGVNLNTCDICKKTFTRKDYLTRHLVVHSGIKEAFKCDICGKTFAYQSSLRLHQSIHTGVNLNTCDICKKTFTRKHDLTRHLAMHSGLQAFKCDMCGRAFSYKKGLKQHKCKSAKL